MSGLQEMWRRGGYQPTPSLALQPDGSLVLRRYRRAAATLSAAEVVVPTWYGRRRAVSRAAVARVVLVRAVLGSSAQATPEPLLLVLDSQGRSLLRLRAVGIPEADLKAFAAALGVPVDVTSKEMGAAELSAGYPGSVSWRESHQTLFVLLVALVIVVIVIVGVIALGAAGVIKPSGHG